MSKQAVVQYTLRGVPREVDRALRARARETGVSVNRLAIEALARGLGQEPPRRDVGFLCGSLSDAGARRLEAEVRRMRTVDPELWPAPSDEPKPDA